jgi:hypothetical protein
MAIVDASTLATNDDARAMRSLAAQPNVEYVCLASAASTNPDCAQNTLAGATCAPGSTTFACYSSRRTAPGAREAAYPAGGDAAVSIE